MSLADLKVKLKMRLPALSWLYSSVRFVRNIRRVVALLSRMEEQYRTTYAGESKERGLIVINSVRTYVPTQVLVEMTLALKLRARGFDVRILYDDDVLFHHETLTRIDFMPFQSYYRLRRVWSTMMLRHLPIIGGMMLPYSRFVNRRDIGKLHDTEIDKCESFDGIKIEPFVRASLVRFFLSAPDVPLLESEPDYRRARRMFVRNAMLSIRAAEAVYNELNPKTVISSHGIYSSWGSFMDMMRSCNVRMITWGVNGFGATSLDFAVDDIAAAKGDGGYISFLKDEVIDNSITRAEVSERVEEWMQKRFNHSTVDISKLGAVVDRSESSLLKHVQRLYKEGSELFALFPNVMWDNATTFEESNRVFSSPVDWLIETVRFFCRSEDKKLIIRVHPAERNFMKARKSIVEILKFHLGHDILSHPNIVIIPPEEPLSSYALFDYIKAGLVYNGTIGLELIFRHVPLIIAAKAAYSDHGFTYDITSRDQYFDAFDNTQTILERQERGLEDARLFAYEYFFLHGIPMLFMSRIKPFEPDYQCSPGQVWTDTKLDHVVAVIAGERKYFQDYWRRQTSEISA